VSLTDCRQGRLEWGDVRKLQWRRRAGRGRLFDDLVAVFGENSVFMDVAAIEVGWVKRNSRQWLLAAFDNLIWPRLDTYNWPHLINKDGCPVLRFQPGWGAGEGTAFEFLHVRSVIEAAAYDAFFF